MDRKCWMLVISMVMTLPSLAGLACQSKGEKASTKAAIQLAGNLRSGKSGAPSEASYDKLIQESDSPELRKFAEDAKAKASDETDMNEIGSEAVGH